MSTLMTTPARRGPLRGLRGLRDAGLEKQWGHSGSRQRPADRDPEAKPWPLGAPLQIGLITAGRPMLLPGSHQRLLAVRAGRRRRTTSHWSRGFGAITANTMGMPRRRVSLSLLGGECPVLAQAAATTNVCCSAVGRRREPLRPHGLRAGEGEEGRRPMAAL